MTDNAAAMMASRDGIRLRRNGSVGGNLGQKRNRDIGYALAANSCERVSNVDTCTVAVLERFLLSQYQTPASPRRGVGFFGSGRRASRPALRITQPTSDWQLFLKPTFRPSMSIRLAHLAQLSTPVVCAKCGRRQLEQCSRWPVSQGFCGHGEKSASASIGQPVEISSGMTARTTETP